jgi:hypothetical protein
MSSLWYFFAAFVLFLVYRGVRASENHLRAAEEKLAQIPPTYRPEVSFGLKATPVLPNGDRIFIGVHLRVTVSVAAPAEDAQNALTPLAQEQISVWALTIAEPFKTESYDSLRSRLLPLEVGFASVKTAAITTIAPIKNKTKTLSLFDQWTDEAKNLKDLSAAKALIDEEEDNDIKELLQSRYRAKIQEFLNPVTL